MEKFAFETGRTPEAHVVELLAARDGKMRQQEIFTETGWSRSSVSRLLCGMEAEEEVVCVRLGTENVVYLPDRFRN
ncbi:helix-turn-helix transcriptional regulator [Haladaptatus sp.]|uniref:helix-turn-helix transcriptional regulator n=1 Tax=Haladaptatus sp. TaxID=1973141 RepID=UPI003C475C35